MINDSYLSQGNNSINHRQNLLKTLMSERRLPHIGWDDLSIEFILYQLALMDSNNFHGNTGAGEREGRVFSNLVRKRHYNLSHGIGRSGDIAEVQPKAAGSSLISILTSALALHAIHISGMKSVKKTLVLPMATGMSLAMCLLTFRKKNLQGKYVIWPRIDQKSCFKCILTAGYTPLVVEPIMQGDELVTNVDEIKRLLLLYSHEIVCILSTTSCFTPRVPDHVDEIAKLCKDFDKFHIINNAYGLQCPYITKLIERAMTIGRVDYIVQSTDKNFMVPVGGAVVASPSEEAITELAKSYPGRASASPIVDLFITLLSMGEQGLRNMWTDRMRLLPVLIDGLHNVALKHRQRLLLCPHNSISIGISLDFSSTAPQESRSENAIPTTSTRQKPVTYFGSMLFQRLVSGARVVDCSNSNAAIAGVSFVGWGAHSAHYHIPYLTIACAVGMTQQEVETVLHRVDKVFVEFRKQQARTKASAVVAAPLPTDAVDSVGGSSTEVEEEPVKGDYHSSLDCMDQGLSLEGVAVEMHDDSRAECAVSDITPMLDRLQVQVEEQRQKAVAAIESSSGCTGNENTSEVVMTASDPPPPEPAVPLPPSPTPSSTPSLLWQTTLTAKRRR